MSDYPETLDHMLAAWNERKAEKVRSHLERALAPNVRFVDPTNDLTGIDAFEKMVHEFRERLPGAVCSRAGTVDSHHELHRYHWEIHQDGERLVQGFDVTETDATGKVTQVLGFFGLLLPPSD